MAQCQQYLIRQRLYPELQPQSGAQNSYHTQTHLNSLWRQDNEIAGLFYETLRRFVMKVN